MHGFVVCSVVKKEQTRKAKCTNVWFILHQPWTTVTGVRSDHGWGFSDSLISCRNAPGFELCQSSVRVERGTNDDQGAV